MFKQKSINQSIVHPLQYLHDFAGYGERYIGADIKLPAHVRLHSNPTISCTWSADVSVIQKRVEWMREKDSKQEKIATYRGDAWGSYSQYIEGDFVVRVVTDSFLEVQDSVAVTFINVLEEDEAEYYCRITLLDGAEEKETSQKKHLSVYSKSRFKYLLNRCSIVIATILFSNNMTDGSYVLYFSSTV